MRRLVERFPKWVFYPLTAPPPDWATSLATTFQDHRAEIESSVRKRGTKLESNEVLALLHDDLERKGYAVERGKGAAERIYRPVLFGEYGLPGKTYNIDAYHPKYRVGLEIEAGRGTKGNAVYRDLVQTSLLVDVDYLALAVLTEYKWGAKGVEYSYRATKEILDAIYASERLRFPMKGILLIGY
jgi:hypothetical protein